MTVCVNMMTSLYDIVVNYFFNKNDSRKKKKTSRKPSQQQMDQQMPKQKKSIHIDIPVNKLIHFIHSRGLFVKDKVIITMAKRLHRLSVYELPSMRKQFNFTQKEIQLNQKRKYDYQKVYIQHVYVDIYVYNTCIYIYMYIQCLCVVCG